MFSFKYFNNLLKQLDFLTNYFSECNNMWQEGNLVSANELMNI